MKVVSCYRAAQIAQVSKQLIIKRKNINAGNKEKYPYFCYDPVTGKFGINIESHVWLEYMQKRQNTAGYDVDNERLLTNKTDDKRGGVDHQNTVDNTALFIKLINVVEESIKEILKPSQKKMDMVKKSIVDKYRGLNV